VFKLAVFVTATAFAAIYPGGLAGIAFLAIAALSIENALKSPAPDSIAGPHSASGEVGARVVAGAPE
jgi:hypothetical protein